MKTILYSLLLCLAISSLSFTQVTISGDTSYISGGTFAGVGYVGEMDSTISNDTIATGANTGQRKNPNAVYALYEGYYKAGGITLVKAKTGVATTFDLSQNYPNPFNPSTVIQFTVHSNGRAVLKVFNVLGQEVATLFNGVATAGVSRQVEFNASNLASGIYFSRLEFGGKMLVKKMLLLK